MNNCAEFFSLKYSEKSSRGVYVEYYNWYGPLLAKSESGLVHNLEMLD